jgi:predicted nucleic acid-binding protein
MATIVDTSVWVDFLSGVSNPHTEWLVKAMTIARIGLTDLILCEILQGIREDAVFAEVKHELMRFEIFATCGTDLAVRSAQNYRMLRANGFTIRKTIDGLIATFCITEGFPLLHRDHDFDPFERHLGLAVLHPEDIPT